MVIFSIIFLVISFVLTNILGPVGFIIANCVNMLARITHSIFFIYKMYKKTKFSPLNGLVPDVKFIVTLTFSGIVTKFSEVSLTVS